MLGQPYAVGRQAEGETIPCHPARSDLQNHGCPLPPANGDCKVDGWRQVHMMAAAGQQTLLEDGLNELPSGAVIQDCGWSSLGPVTLHSHGMALASADFLSALGELKALLVAPCHQRLKLLR